MRVNNPAITPSTSAPGIPMKVQATVNTTPTMIISTIANGTADPIAPGDPFYFQIASGFSTSVVNGIEQQKTEDMAALSA